MPSMVSVIIPTFNRAYCLPLAISSVLAQSYQNLEIIVVDDNSSDNTGQICRRFQSEFGDKIRYIRNYENLGPAKSRNVGIDEAMGEFITFLDSDDLYYVDKIELQVELLRKNPAAGFCYGHFTTTFDVFDTSLFHYEKWIPPQDLYPAYLLPNSFYIVTPAVMLRSVLLKRIGGFDPSMHICEDLELWSRALLETRAVCVTKPIVAIHIRKDENIKFMSNIVARDQLYERLFSRDQRLDEDFKKQLYSDLVDLYLEMSQTKSLSPEINDTLKAMRKACKKPFTTMRSEIMQLASEMSY